MKRKPPSFLVGVAATALALPPRIHHVEFRHHQFGRLDAGPWDFAKHRHIVGRRYPQR